MTYAFEENKNFILILSWNQLHGFPEQMQPRKSRNRPSQWLPLGFGTSPQGGLLGPHSAIPSEAFKD